MAGIINGNTISNIYYKVKEGSVVTIQSIYKGTQKIWSSIKEAFGAFSAGFWQNDKPWQNNDPWKDQ